MPVVLGLKFTSMSEQEYHLSFLNRSRSVGSITMTTEDCRAVDEFAKSHNLDAEAPFSMIFRKMYKELGKPVPANEPDPPKAQIPQGHVLVRVTERDEKCLAVRMKKGKSSGLSEMFRQAVDYLNKKPLGDLYTGPW